VPGAGNSLATGVNNSGDVVGWYIGTDSNQHGFILSKGVFTTFDAPGAEGLTAAADINDEGIIVGEFGPGFNQGFIATPIKN
jgi:probable HAF family extracellular repeat protein